MLTLRLLSLILFSISLSALAQLPLKVGVERAGTATAASEAAPIVQRISGMLFSPFVLSGLMTYAFGTLLWLFVLAKAPLSAAYPFVGAGFILAALMGALILGDERSRLRISGIYRNMAENVSAGAPMQDLWGQYAFDGADFALLIDTIVAGNRCSSHCHRGTTAQHPVPIVWRSDVRLWHDSGRVGRTGRPAVSGGALLAIVTG